MADAVQWIGVYLTDDGPIEVREDMSREQMWTVLQVVGQFAVSPSWRKG